MQPKRQKRESHVKNSNRRWTPEGDEQLRECLAANLTVTLIATKLKRSVQAIQARAYILKISMKHASGGPKARLATEHFEARLKRNPDFHLEMYELIQNAQPKSLRDEARCPSHPGIAIEFILKELGQS